MEKNGYAEMVLPSKRLRLQVITALVQDVYSEVETTDLRVFQKQRWTAVGHFINKSVILSCNEQTTFKTGNTDFKINNGEFG
jgi:hypothetical protein